MAYFTQNFTKFFAELEKNNNKDWFDANRKRYETDVKKPFTAFIDEMINRIHAEDPQISILAKDALLRINRDIRFSPDKTPYNTHFGAIISTAGRKDKSIPGIYFRFSAKGIEIYGGAHGVSKEQLQGIRESIAAHPDAFKKAINDKQFKAKFGHIQGEQHKRIPSEFKEAVEVQPLIANKQFYYGAEVDKKVMFAEDLPEKLMEYWRAGEPVRQFLLAAMA